jgi:tetratricopeptide (TPR) repeat protein
MRTDRCFAWLASALASALLLTAPVTAQMNMPMPMASSATSLPPETARLGKVDFATSCAASQQAAFNRAVALQHDFWYEAAGQQFAAIAKADPGCAMAYWGEAMAGFHQIWDRPDALERKAGLNLLASMPKDARMTPREHAYVDALAGFFRPDSRSYQQRIGYYSAAMGKLYAAYPDDVDAGAFYALSLLAMQDPGDTTLTLNRRAMTVLTPLFAKAPDNPGVDHYIIHACDTPALAREGLAAANHYGEVAPDGAHAVHMPGHIYARLGMWKQDIEVDEQAVRDSQQAQAAHTGGPHDQLHAEDFLVYAYVQSGDDARARSTIAAAEAVMAANEGAGGVANHGLGGLFEYYRTELPMIYTLEMRDWTAASNLQPVKGASPSDQVMTYWARAIGAGHLHDAAAARRDAAHLEAALAEIRKGAHPEDATGTFNSVRKDELHAWVAYAEGNKDAALLALRTAAELQDKVGQAEVDIPAREMLADMLLELHEPAKALAEYRRALELSPNRFNGLYHAGTAAEQAGEKTVAAGYYAQLLRQTGGGANTTRPEVAHARQVVGDAQVAAR